MKKSNDTIGNRTRDLYFIIFLYLRVEGGVKYPVLPVIYGSFQRYKAKHISYINNQQEATV